MTGQSAESSRQQADNREHIWLVALYEFEARAEELLERLRAIGVDTSEATTVRVEIDENQRAARYVAVNESALSPVARSAVTGALLGGSVALLIGLVVYGLGLFMLPLVAGLFHHALFSVMIGAVVGALVGSSFSSARQKKSPQSKLPQMPQPTSAGYLVAVKMPPPLAERAEEIARGLGAKEILL
jgi:post-segregation antitoxin (ccd killing protein)